MTIKFIIITISGCTCMDYINKNGYGNCKKQSTNLGGKFTCYVNQPSSCTDRKDSGTDPGKQYSAEACKEQNQGNLCFVMSDYSIYKP